MEFEKEHLVDEDNVNQEGFEYNVEHAMAFLEVVTDNVEHTMALLDTVVTDNVEHAMALLEVVTDNVEHTMALLDTVVTDNVEHAMALLEVVTDNQEDLKYLYFSLKIYLKIKTYVTVFCLLSFF